MVGGDRQSPPRHKAKGSGTKGKGGGGSDELNLESDGKGRIGNVMQLSGNGGEFKFGGRKSEMSTMDDTLAVVNKEATLDDLVRDRDGKETSGVVSSITPLGERPPPIPFTYGNSSWVMEVEACEELERARNGGSEVVKMVTALEHGGKSAGTEVHKYSRSPLKTRSKTQAVESRTAAIQDSDCKPAMKADPIIPGSSSEVGLPLQFGSIVTSVDGSMSNACVEKECWNSGAGD